MVRREAYVTTCSDYFYLMGAALLPSLVPILLTGRPGKGKARADHRGGPLPLAAAVPAP
ncbi:MAG TPA: hypothetical protein VGE42_02945 [Candidatus Dormibacteraeota bacterium]